MRMSYRQTVQTVLYRVMGYDEAPDTLVRIEEAGNEIIDLIEKIDAALRPVEELSEEHGGDLGFDGKKLVFEYLREYLDEEFGA